MHILTTSRRRCSANGTNPSAATLSSPTPSGTLGTDTSAILGATTNQASGTIYGVVDSAANLSGITAAQIKAGQNKNSAAAVSSGSGVASALTISVTVSGLSAATGYSYALVQNNVAGDSNVVTGTFTTAAGSSFDYYIGPSGSDSNAGTSGSPWAITALNTKCATYTGKTVGLLDGTYNLYSAIIALSSVDNWALDVDGGSAANPTIIKAVNARQAILTGKNGSTYGNANGYPMLGHSGTTTHRGYVTFDGLKITGCPRLGIRIGIFGSSPQIAGITVKNCEFTDFKGTSLNAGLNLEQLELNNCTGHLIQNNYFHDNVGYAVNSSNHFSSILQWQSDRGIYEYNTIVNSGGIYGKESGQYGQTIRFNYVDVSALTDTASAIQDFNGNAGSASTTTSVHHNILIGAKPWEGLDTLSDAPAMADNLECYNNTYLSKNSASSRGIRIKTVAGRTKFFNNIAVDQATGDHCIVGLNVDADGTVDYNLYYNTTSDPRWSTYPNASSTTRSTVTTFAAWKSAMGGSVDAHGISGSDPLFVGSGVLSLFYQLQSGSPAKNAGKSDGTTGGTTCDMGAWGNNPPARIGSDF